MGELFIKKADSPWDLSVVENAGEIPVSSVKDEIVVSVTPLQTDIKAQLMFVPRTLTYTVGWRALVWQNKETNQFQDLTEEEFAAYVDGGIVTYTRGSGKDTQENESAEGDAGSSA